MEQRDNKNRGALWPNDKKSQQNHPDYRGQVDVEGVKYWVSAWAGNGSNPKAPALSFSIKKADAAPITQHNQEKGDGYQRQPGDESDAVPF